MTNRLRVARAERRITQFRLGLATGINSARLSQMENDLVKPHPDEVRALARVLMFTPEQLFPGIEEETESRIQKAAV